MEAFLEFLKLGFILIVDAVLFWSWSLFPSLSLCLWSYSCIFVVCCFLAQPNFVACLVGGCLLDRPASSSIFCRYAPPLMNWSRFRYALRRKVLSELWRLFSGLLVELNIVVSRSVSAAHHLHASAFVLAELPVAACCEPFKVL